MHFTHAKAPVVQSIPNCKTADTSTWAVGGNLQPCSRNRTLERRPTPACQQNRDSSNNHPALRCFHNTSEVVEATSAAPSHQPVPECDEICIYITIQRVLAARRGRRCGPAKRQRVTPAHTTCAADTHRAYITSLAKRCFRNRSHGSIAAWARALRNPVRQGRPPVVGRLLRRSLPACRTGYRWPRLPPGSRRATARTRRCYRSPVRGPSFG